jgi:hypothetical protein
MFVVLLGRDKVGRPAEDPRFRSAEPETGNGRSQDTQERRIWPPFGVAVPYQSRTERPAAIWATSPRARGRHLRSSR